MSKHIALVILGALILCFAGFNNKYPLLTSKSNEYIQKGFTREVPQNSTITYGLFVAHSSWGKSLWLTIFSQSLVLSLVLFYYFHYLSNCKYNINYYLVCIFLVTFIMSASISVSNIDPGITGTISILGIGLLLFAENLIKRDRNIILLTVIICLGMNPAILLTTIFMMIACIIFLLIKKNRLSISGKLPNVKNTSFVFLIVLLSYLLASLVNLLVGDGFNIFKSEKETVTIEQIMPDKSSIFQNTLDNLFHLDVAENLSLKDSTEIVQAINDRYNSEVREFYLSKQISRLLNYNYLNYSNYICIIIFLILSLALKKGLLSLYLLQFFILAYIMYAFSNALIYRGCVHSQHNIAWIIVIPALLYITKISDLAILRGKNNNK